MAASNKRRHPGLWAAAKSAAFSWVAHKDARAGASLAYYSIFSIGPLIVIAIAITGLVFGQEAVQSQVIETLQGLLGESGAKAIEAMLASAGKHRQGIMAMGIGAATLVYGAIGVVVQLKDAFNDVWEVEETPGRGFWHFARTYVLSFAAVIAGAFLLLVSMLLSAALAAVGKYFGTFVPEVALQAAGSAVSFAVIAALFALMLKGLPDAEVAWSDAFVGALITAALFEGGKFLIALYIGKEGLESTYGAAASVVIVLVWVYYTAQIVLLGAEFTRAWADRE